MNIGSLKQVISLEAPTVVSDRMGGWNTVWKTMASNLPAAIWPVSATEQIKSQGVTMTMTHRIRIRYRSDIRSSWRIEYKDSYFNIISLVNYNMANRSLDIVVKEI